MFASRYLPRGIVALLLALPAFSATIGQEVERQDESAATAASQDGVADWTQWRGPDRSGMLEGAEWPDSLSDSTLTEKWSIPLQPSYSGPIVVGDQVFVTETVDKKMEVVRALNRETGEECWSTEWEGAMSVPMFARRNGSWIRSTPCYDEGRLYVGGIRDVFVCLNAETGEEIWKKDFVQDTGAPVPTFGCVCSPMVDGDYLYVQAGGGLCKLEKATGELVWRALADGGGMMGSAFSSPVIAEVSGKRQLVIQTRESLCGVEIENGEILWSVDIPSFRGMNILTPVVFDDAVFTSTYGGTTQMINVNTSGESFDVRQRWEVGGEGYMSSPVVIDGHAYLVMKNRTIACFDLESGERKWASPRFSEYASLVSNGNKILALDSSGKLILFNASPDKYEQLDIREVSDDSWAHIGIRGDQLFVRELNAMTVFDWKSE
ncbi:MAG: PQQ-binding-like beta-propeller repeat protein [Planctomycetota bacterium]